MHIKSPEDFSRLVFEKGDEPKLEKRWSLVLKETISGCWCNMSKLRPVVGAVIFLIKPHITNIN